MAKLIPFILLIVGLIGGYYLVTRPQPTTIESQANSNITDYFVIYDGNGNEVQCLENENGIPVCEIETLQFEVAVEDPTEFAQ